MKLSTRDLSGKPAVPVSCCGYLAKYPIFEVSGSKKHTNYGWTLRVVYNPKRNYKAKGLEATSVAARRK